MDLEALSMTLTEVAAAAAYLHVHSLIHRPEAQDHLLRVLDQDLSSLAPLPGSLHRTMALPWTWSP